MSELSEMKCQACEGGIPPLTREQAEDYLKRTPDWTIVEDKKIERVFKFKNFIQAMDFANKIAEIAESENHHPDLHISWGKVRVEISTHAIGGLSINDFILAAKIDKLPI